MTIEAGIEVPVNSRISVHANPDNVPGFCSMCRSAGGDDRSFIDIGFQLDYYGTVYFCSFCLTEISEAVGFSPSIKLKQVEEKLIAVQRELSINEESFRDYRDATRQLLRDCVCHDQRNSSVVPISSVSDTGDSKGSAK